MVAQSQEPQEGGSSSINSGEGTTSSTGTATGPTVSEALDTLVAAMGRETREAFNGLKKGGAELGKKAREFGNEVLNSAGDRLQAAARVALRTVSGDPKIKTTFVEKIIRIIPIVGTTKMYADAWSKYHEAMKNKDEAKLIEARKDCLLAFSSAGVDLVSMGAGRLFASFPRVMKAATTARALAGLHNTQSKFFDRTAAKLLRIEGVSKTIDAILAGVQPEAPAPEEQKS